MYIAILFIVLIVLAILAVFEDDEIQAQTWLLVVVATVLSKTLLIVPISQIIKFSPPPSEMELFDNIGLAKSFAL